MKQAMREHRHAARRGSQSASKAGQRRLTARRSNKGSDAIRQTNQPVLEAESYQPDANP